MKRLQGLSAQTASLEEQIAIHQARRRKAKEEDQQNGEQIRLAAVKFEREEKEKKARHLALELKNQQALNQQVSDRLAKNPPGRDPMTALDVMLNRDLLVSKASGKAYVPTSRIELG